MGPLALIGATTAASAAAPIIGNLVSKNMYPGMTSSTPMNLAYLSAFSQGQVPVPTLQDITYQQYATP